MWTPAQLATFLDAAQGHRLSACYRLAAYTGARRGELLNVRWRDVDLDAAEITLTGSTAVIDRQRHDDSIKGGRSRIVSLDPGTVAVLREHRKRQATERLAAGAAWSVPASTCSSRRRALRFTRRPSRRSCRRSPRRLGSPTRRPTTCGIYMRPRCCSRESRSTSSRPGSGMPIRASRCAFTPTCCESRRPASRTCLLTQSPAPVSKLLARSRERAPALRPVSALTCAFTVGTTGFEPATP